MATQTKKKSVASETASGTVTRTSANTTANKTPTLVTKMQANSDVDTAETAARRRVKAKEDNGGYAATSASRNAAPTTATTTAAAYTTTASTARVAATESTATETGTNRARPGAKGRDAAATRAQVSAAELRSIIEKEAYRIAEQRGFGGGEPAAIRDWLEAEARVTQQYQRTR